MKFQVTRGNVNAQARVIVVIDKQSNGMLPVIGDVLEDTASSTESMVSLYDPQLSKRFTVLFDRRWNCENDIRTQYFGTMRRRLTHQIRFDGAGPGITDISSGAIVMLGVGTEVGGADSPSMTVGLRIWFAP